MSTQARLAPSKAHRWMNCPGSIAASEGKEDPTSVYAAEGTVAHELLEGCLKYGFNAIGALGQVKRADGFTFTVDQEMVDAVQAALDYVREVRDRKPASRDGKVEVWVERRDGLDKIKDLPEPIFGTTDVCMWDPFVKQLDIFDFKYGKGVVVEVEENEQLMIYALTQVLRIGVRPEKIVLHVMQPRAHHDEGPMRSWETDFDTLVEFKVRVVEAAKAVQDPDAPLNPGAWCKFCPALPTCPAHTKLAVAVAAEEFADPPPSREAAQLPEPVDMDMARLVFALKHMNTVREWFNAVEEHAMHLLNTGVEVPGFKLVRGRSNRQWKDEEAAEAALTKAGLKKKERTVTKVLSVAQAEKVLKAKGKQLDANLWEKPEGKLTLVPAADKRPAVSGVQEDFGALPSPTEPQSQENEAA